MNARCTTLRPIDMPTRWRLRWATFAYNASIVVVGIVLSMAAMSCETTHRESLPSPRVPDESIGGHTIYPESPTTITLTALTRLLGEMDHQRTLVYVIGAHAQVNRDELACVDAAHRAYYRYGLRTIVVDLRPAQNWHALTAVLTTIGADVMACRLRESHVAMFRRRVKMPDEADRYAVLLAGETPVAATTSIRSCRVFLDRIRERLGRSTTQPMSAGDAL